MSRVSTTRANLELEVVETVATMTQEDSRATVDSIRTQMRRLMLPEGKRGSITLHTVLHWFGISDINGLLHAQRDYSAFLNSLFATHQKKL